MFQTIIKNYNQHSHESFNPRVVLFDMDGVLYDSMPNHAIAWTKAMGHFGLPFTEEDAYSTEGAKGVDTIRIYAQKLLGKQLSETEAAQMYKLKAEYFHQMPQPKIFNGVKKLMHAIKSEGLQIGIVTGSAQRQLIDRLLSDFHEFITPEQVTTAFDVKNGKPAPDPYLAGLRKAGNLAPHEGIVIENAPLGIQAGTNAGCFTIAVNSGPLSNEILLEKNPQLLYPSIEKLFVDWPTLIAEAKYKQTDKMNIKKTQ